MHQNAFRHTVTWTRERSRLEKFGSLKVDEELGTPCIHLVSVQVFTISAVSACILFISKG